MNSFLIMKRVWSVSKKKHSSNVSTPRSKQTNENLDSQLPEHLSPSPEKPVLQTQVNEPMVLIHLALRSHIRALALHSSMSGEKIKSPYNVKKIEISIKYNRKPI